MGWQVMNNFVFHEEYIVDIPAEKLTEFLNYIVQYGLYNKVPSLKGFELVYWKTIQRRIDNDKNFYEITCLKRKINAINVRVRNNKASENDLSNLEQYQTKLNELNEVKRDYSFNTKLNELNEKNEVKLTHYDIDSDIDIDTDYDTDIDSDIDTDIEHHQMPSKSTPSMTQYSKELFDLFKNAGLPCARNNEISFMQTDFTNALSYLHKTSEYQHIHSSDVIGAVKNYIQVLQNPDCYVSSKMNLFQLVKSKNFYNYLPANFDESNFLNFNADGKKKEKKEIEFEVVHNWNCPDCGKKRVYFNPNSRKYICDACFTMFDSIEGADE